MSITSSNYLLCCRVCLETEKSEFFFSIFDNHLPETNISLRDALQKTTGIQSAPGDSLPSKICQSCHLRLQGAYQFIMESSTTNSLLQSLRTEALEVKHREPETLATPKLEAPLESTDPSNDNLLQEERVSGSDSTSLLQIERLEHGSQMVGEYLIVGVEKPETSEVMSAYEDDPEEDVSESAIETDSTQEDPTDAVDFILKNFQNPRKYTKKKASQTSPSRRHQCEVCEKSFQRKSNLVDHLRLHANVKLFSCNFCEASFVQSGNLKSHLRKHTLEKPYGCDMCGKRYSQSSALKTHIRSHTNTRNYICDVCTKGFTNSSDLTKHKATHSDLRFFQCVVCVSRYFTQKIHLKKHLQAYHLTDNFEKLLSECILKEGVRVNTTPSRRVAEIVDLSD